MSQCFSVRSERSCGITVLHAFEIISEGRSIVKVWKNTVYSLLLLKILLIFSCLFVGSLRSIERTLDTKAGLSDFLFVAFSCYFNTSDPPWLHMQFEQEHKTLKNNVAFYKCKNFQNRFRSS